MEEKRLESKLCQSEATCIARQATRWLPREACRAAGSALSVGNNTDPVQLVSFTIFTALLRAAGMTDCAMLWMDVLLLPQAMQADKPTRPSMPNADKQIEPKQLMTTSTYRNRQLYQSAIVTKSTRPVYIRDCDSTLSTPLASRRMKTM